MMRKCFILLILYLIGIYMASGIKVTKSKRPSVTDLPVDGANCQVGKTLFCHREIRFRFAPTTAKICNNGRLKTMVVPSTYKNPAKTSKECPCLKTCVGKKEVIYAHEADVPPKPNRSTLKRQCLCGVIYLVNTVLGTKVPDRSFKK
jgi:hypothetical protein